MHNLLRCRRGSAAFATVIALVPLIGVVSLGGEAASWYVTKQHAQNAADSAAMSGAMTIAIQTGGDPALSDSQTYVYRAKQFAAQNAFCNAGDTSYPGSLCATTLPTGISQTVQIDRGTYDSVSRSWTTAALGSFVRATVSQQQPTYLAKVLGLSTVTIPAQAIAQVKSDDTKKLCAVGLGRYPSPTQSALEFAGNETLSGNGCGFQSDNTVKYASAPTFNGTGWAVYASTGCVNSGNCDPGVPYNYAMQPATNPLAAKLDTKFTTFSGNGNPCTGLPNGNVTNGKNCPIAPNTPTTAYGNLNVHAGGTATFQTGGTFFFNGSALIFSGTVTGTNVNIVLLGNSSLSITGGSTILSANFSNTTYPDLNGVLFDDQACRLSTNPCPSLKVNINGGAGVTIALGGTMYFPNVDVTMSGNSQNANTQCTEVIANSLKFSGGTSYLSTQSCISPTGTPPRARVVALVQ